MALFEHELVNGLLILCEFSALFATSFNIIILIVPDLAAIIFVAKTFVVNNKIIITTRSLSSLIFVGIYFLKDLLGFFNLNDHNYFTKERTSYWSVRLMLPSLAAFSFYRAVVLVSVMPVRLTSLPLAVFCLSVIVSIQFT
jgi:hypothetical protein